MPNPQLHTLTNGLDVLVQEDHNHPLASVQVWVRAGSIHEEDWSGGGMAHLCEHMLFKGTASRSAQQISLEIQSLGGYVNAYTSFNRTVYYIEGLSENVPGYLSILADMVQHSKLDPEELAREKDVIRREMAMDHDDAGSLAQHLLQATAFKVHPLRHPIIGHRSVFDQISHADLVRFVKRHYSPNRCFVVVTGAVEADKVFALAEEQFGAWERQPGDPVHLPSEPAQLSPRNARQTFPTDITRVMLGWPIPGDTAPDRPALEVLAFLLSSGRSSRLYRELRVRQSVAHSVWAGAWSCAECGLFSAEAECDPADAERAEKGLKEVIATMVAKGPTKAELAKAVRATIAGQYRQLATTRGQASMLGQGWLVAHSLSYRQDYLAAIESLTPAAIQETAARYLRPEAMSTVVVEPQQSAVAKATSAIVPLKKPAVTRTELPNGLVVIVGANARLPLVSVRSSFLAGVLAESEDNAGITQVTAQTLLRGAKTRTADALAAALEDRGGSLGALGDAHRFIFSAEVVRGDESLALDLIHDLASAPVLAPAAVESVKKRQLANIREEQEDPLTVALRKTRRQIFSGTPFARTALGHEASVSSLSPIDCRNHLKTHVVGQNGVISVFGDVDPQKVLKGIKSTLGKLPKGARRVDTSVLLPHKGKAGSWKVRMEKEQAVLVIGFRTAALTSDETYPLSLIDEACSDMGSRLFNRIREELGLAYYVGTQHFMAIGGGAFYFYVGTDPAKLDLAKAEMLKQIGDLAKNGLHKDELDRARTTWRSQWLRAQQGNGPMAEARAWDELTGQGFQHFDRLPDIIANISPAQVKAAARKYFDPKAAFITEVLPK
ncbi:MAG: insulinase family protein [Verrucomicrobiaceae bacterium]|nr:insulinase family protein [Verrucomicrobiaceae bacterium]